MRTVATEAWEDLVVAVLAVNNYSIEKAYALIGRLRAEGLCNPEILQRLDQPDIAARLKEAGYDRGSFLNNLLALRLCNLGSFLSNKGVEHCTRIISGPDVNAIRELLVNVKGIGPTTVKHFCLLRGLLRES